MPCCECEGWAAGVSSVLAATGQLRHVQAAALSFATHAPAIAPAITPTVAAALAAAEARDWAKQPVARTTGRLPVDALCD
jgi:hypothetical protein